MVANIYVDNSSGNDTTGSGTTGSPYKTITKAISVCNGGDTIWLSNSSAFTLTTAIVWTGAGSTTAISVAAPLIIKAWNNGGSIVISHPSGNIVAAEINGNGAAASIFSTSSMPSYVSLEGIKMHGTTSLLLTPTTGWNFYQCEFYGNVGGSSYMVNCASNTNTFMSCYFHDDNGSLTAGLNLNSFSAIIGCFFSGISGYAVRLSGNSTLVTNNIFSSSPNGCITSSAVENYIFNNTFIGTGASSQGGIVLTSAARRHYIYSNLITDFNGTSSTGINFQGSANAQLLGNNGFRNNTSNITSKNVSGQDLTSHDISETSTPYTNSSAGDYSLVSTAVSKATALPTGITGTSTLSSIDIGASQRQETGGGSSVSRGTAHAV